LSSAIAVDSARFRVVCKVKRIKKLSGKFKFVPINPLEQFQVLSPASVQSMTINKLNSLGCLAIKQQQQEEEERRKPTPQDQKSKLYFGVQISTKQLTFASFL